MEMRHFSFHSRVVGHVTDLNTDAVDGGENRKLIETVRFLRFFPTSQNPIGETNRLKMVHLFLVGFYLLDQIQFFFDARAQWWSLCLSYRKAITFFGFYLFLSLVLSLSFCLCLFWVRLVRGQERHVRCFVYISS